MLKLTIKQGDRVLCVHEYPQPDQELPQANVDVAKALEKTVIIGNDAGHTFTHAWYMRTFNENGQPVSRRILLSPKGLQQTIKLHSRNVAELRRQFPIPLDWLLKYSRQRNDGKTAAALNILQLLYRTSFKVRSEAWLLRKRRQEQMDRIADQVLEACGARAGRFAHTTGTFSQHTQPNLKVIFALGADCKPAQGIKVHTADFRNAILRAIIAKIGWQRLAARTMLVKEGFTSQACPDQDCIRAPGEDWQQYEVVQDDWIRSR